MHWWALGSSSVWVLGLPHRHVWCNDWIRPMWVFFVVFFAFQLMGIISPMAKCLFVPTQWESVAVWPWTVFYMRGSFFKSAHPCFRTSSTLNTRLPLLLGCMDFERICVGWILSFLAFYRSLLKILSLTWLTGGKTLRCLGSGMCCKHGAATFCRKLWCRISTISTDWFSRRSAPMGLPWTRTHKLLRLLRRSLTAPIVPAVLLLRKALLPIDDLPMEYMPQNMPLLSVRLVRLAWSFYGRRIGWLFTWPMHPEMGGEIPATIVSWRWAFGLTTTFRTSPALWWEPLVKKLFRLVALYPRSRLDTTERYVVLLRSRSSASRSFKNSRSPRMRKQPMIPWWPLWIVLLLLGLPGSLLFPMKCWK